MREPYFQFLQKVKTYLKHHSRGVTFVHPFPLARWSQGEYVSSELEGLQNISAATSSGEAARANDPLPQDSPRPEAPADAPHAPPYEQEVPLASYDEEPPYLEGEVEFDPGDGNTKKINDPNHPDVSTLDMTRTAMTVLEQFWAECLACKLGPTRKNMVFGEGAVPAPIFFIGEGPGANEDRMGRPFVGKAGQLLEKMITAMGLSREEVYIGNIVKCRPPGNRDPEMSEMLACMPVLLKQIQLVQPQVIVTLGRIAAQALLSTTRPLGRLRGSWHDYEGVPLLPTYHPAYLLRNPGAKGKAWEDLQMVMARLGLNKEGA